MNTFVLERSALTVNCTLRKFPQCYWIFTSYLCIAYNLISTQSFHMSLCTLVSVFTFYALVSKRILDLFRLVFYTINPDIFLTWVCKLSDMILGLRILSMIY